VPLPILTILDGIVNDVSPEFAKAFVPKLVTVEGIDMVLSEEQELNVSLLIDVKPELVGKVIEVRLVQP